MPVDNQRPVFEAVDAPEFLHIYEYRPGVTHFVPRSAQAMNDSATDLALAGQAEQAEQLRRSLAIDYGASTTWTRPRTWSHARFQSRAHGNR